jgi:hypothetical protein
MASPSHHTHQSSPNRSQTARPETQSDVTPIVALASVLAQADSPRRRSTSRKLARELRKPARPSSQAPRTASRVLPKAMPQAPSGGTLVKTLARKAPSAIPGQTDRPRSQTAARAIPVGGQTTDTCSATEASFRLSFAATKYNAAIATI